MLHGHSLNCLYPACGCFLRPEGCCLLLHWCSLCIASTLPAAVSCALRAAACCCTGAASALPLPRLRLFPAPRGLLPAAAAQTQPLHRPPRSRALPAVQLPPCLKHFTALRQGLHPRGGRGRGQQAVRQRGKGHAELHDAGAAVEQKCGLGGLHGRGQKCELGGQLSTGGTPSG